MQVSHSRIETFKKCPYQYKLKYIDKLTTYFNEDPTNPLIIGTALHTGIERDTKSAIDEYYSKYSVIGDKHVDEVIKLEEVIKKCRELIPSGLYETKIECDEFIGFIDLLVPLGTDEDGHELYDMYDFKYSNNIKNYLESGQLHEYKYYFERLNPNKHIRRMYFLFAPKVSIRMKYKNKTNPRDETINEFRKRLLEELKNKDAQLIEVEYDIEKVKDFLRSAKECRMATQFPKQPSRLCDWCEYQKYCEEGDEFEIMNLPKNERRKIEANTYKKIWLYGAPFSGKTYLANKFPDPLMLNTDGNVKYVDAPFIAMKDEVTVGGRLTNRKFAWDKFKETVDELEMGSEFKTIVVDLLEDINDYCRVEVCDNRGWEHESDDSFKAYDIVRSEFLRTLKRLLNLDYNIILISHEDTSRDITKRSSDKVTQIKPNINDKLANKIAGMVDLVARVIDNDGQRILSFKNNEVIFGGGRLTLNVSEIPCDYDALCKIYDEANKGTVKKTEATPVVKSVEEKPLDGQMSIDELDVATSTTVAEVPETPKRKSRKSAPVEETNESEKSEEVAEEPTPRRRRRKSEE
jgi:phage nucleotide-binding protein